MPKGYELDKYYDSLRAVNRTLFSKQIKIFSGVLDKIGYRNSDTYKLVISSINNGLYDNLGDLYNKTHFGNNPKSYIGLNKSSYDQDFMSPMELRMCAMAVRRACKQIESLRGGYSVKNIQDICYSAGEEVASEFRFLTQGKEEFCLRISEPVLSAKPIIKKYNHALLMGTLPKGQLFTYSQPDQKEEKNKLIYTNNHIFAMIKERLITLGFNSAQERARAYAKFNTGFYETDMANTHILEITKIILTNKEENYISIEELKTNIDKLAIMKNALDRVGYGTPCPQVLNLLEKTGKNARHTLIAKYKTLPELHSGFYHTFIDADKKFVYNKTLKQEQQKNK